VDANTEGYYGEIHFKTGFGRGLCGAVSATGGAQVPPNATGWSASNYNESANRYSPLDQITAANVATLQPAWRFHLKPAGYTGPLKVDEAIPVVIGNTMYIASPYGAIHALDATTGVEKWKFQLPNHDVPSKRGLAYCRAATASSRRSSSEELRAGCTPSTRRTVR